MEICTRDSQSKEYKVFNKRNYVYINVYNRLKRQNNDRMKVKEKGRE